MQKLVKLGLAAILLLVPLGFSVSVEAQTLPPANTIYSSISVYLDDVDQATVYNFVTDLLNDELWFPGIVSTELISQGANPPVGNEYFQVANFGGLITETDIEVLSAYSPYTFFIRGISPITDFWAFYTVTPQYGGGAVYTLTSIYTAPGLTEENFPALITGALSGLLTYFESDGHVEVNFVFEGPSLPASQSSFGVSSQELMMQDVSEFGAAAVM